MEIHLLTCLNDRYHNFIKLSAHIYLEIKTLTRNI